MQAAIFDFDGTLANSAYVWEAVDKHFFESRNMQIPADYADKIGTLNIYDGAVFTKNTYKIPDSVEDIIAEWQNGAIFEYENNVTLKPFADKYIRKLKSKGIKIGLATASPPQFYAPVLKKYGIFDLFDAFADATCKLRSKEFPDIFLHCAQLLDVKPEKCTVYEDILPAIISAGSANISTVAVYEQKSQKDWDKIKKAATHSITSFEQLL